MIQGSVRAFQQRFDVAAVSYPSRGVKVSTGDVPALSSRLLNRLDAVIVGGIDLLSEADRAALDRFMRERSGSVVLLPDAQVADARLHAWMGIGRPREMLLERGVPLSMMAPLPAIEVCGEVYFGSHALEHAAGALEVPR